MRVSKEALLDNLQNIIRMDKGPVRRLEWDLFKTSVLMYNRFGTCIESVYTGAMSPTNIALVVTARASSLKGGN